MLTTEQAAYGFAFHIGDALIRSGASSASTTKSLLSIFRRADMPDATVSVTMGQITVSRQPETDVPPHTRVYEAQPGTLDMALRSNTSEVLERFALGRITAEEGIEAMKEVDARAEAPGHIASLVGFGMFGVGFSLLLGGGLLTTISAALIAALVYGATAVVERVEAPEIFSLGAGGLMAVLGATASGMLFDASQTAVCIVASLAAWLAGIAAYGAVQDVITGWYLSATGRLLDTLTRTAGLVAGVTLGIHVMTPLTGGALDYLETVGVDQSHWGIAVAGAALVSAGFALSSGGRGWKVAALAVFGGLVQLCVLVLGASGAGSYLSIVIASVAAGAVCVALTRPLNLSSNASMMVVLLPLFPGMLVYQGVLGTIFAMEGAGAAVLEAAITAFCLSVGGMLGQYLASEALWATRRRQFVRTNPGQVFRKQMPDEQNSRDIMVPIFSKPFSQ